MAPEDGEELEARSSVLHWNYRNLKLFPPSLLRGGHRCRTIKDIYLKENLISRLPGEIAVLDRLESLYLSGNEISSVPKEIGLLQRLRCLDLSGNLLTTLPEEMGQLSGLRDLVLDDNMLQALPLRLADIRGLRYLSVCDNQLRWLPQRPVYNSRHCELRVWRNPALRCLPYSLWFHMFRDQPIRCYNIGCLGISGGGVQNDCILNVHSEAAVWETDIRPPTMYRRPVSPHHPASPAALLELCLRRVYRALTARASTNRRRLLDTAYSPREAAYSPHDADSHSAADENNNDSCTSASGGGGGAGGGTARSECGCGGGAPQHPGLTTAELVDRHLHFLPVGLKEDLRSGPLSSCENIACKAPVFDYAYLQFYVGSLRLPEGARPVLLSGAFCSRTCAGAPLHAARPVSYLRRDDGQA